MKSEINNYNEEVNKRTILEGVKGLTPELRKAILSAEKSEQRKLIFKVMVDNNVEHRLIGDKIQKLIEQNNLYSTRHIKTVVKMLREYVGVSATEIKSMGEVMTPTSLVNDMLDTLPKEVWSNPELKWLDPCNGVGIFPAVIIDRLMEGLMSFEPNEELRYKHIMEEMIYVSELQAKNLFLYLYAFDPEDKFSLNVYSGSYLDSQFDIHMSLVDVEKFDIVVMNPPYNAEQNGIGSKPKSLWDKFVSKTLETTLVENGYLVAVHPSGWRNVAGLFKNVQTQLLECEIQHLNMNSMSEGKKIFGATTDFDYYCLKNVPNTNIKTKIIDRNDKIDNISLSNVQFIPSTNVRKVYSLLAKDGEETVDILHNCIYHTQKDYVSKEQTEEFKYPCIQNVNVKDDLSCVWYSNVDKGHFGIPKVIFGRKQSGVYVDETGESGMAEDCSAIVDTVENLQLIKTALKNEYFLKNIMGWSGLEDRYNRKIIALFRKDFWKEFV